jgi:hypothetical protein
MQAVVLSELKIRIEPLIFRNRRIDLVAPGRNASRHIAHVLEAILLQQINCLLTPPARFAVRDDFGLRVELAQMFGQLT